MVLVNIHEEYYKRYNKDSKPDLTEIIPTMKSKVLEGITVLFSGIIPLGINLDSADIVIWCKQFGVKVVNEVYPEITMLFVETSVKTLDLHSKPEWRESCTQIQSK